MFYIITTCLIWIPVLAFIFYMIGLVISFHGKQQLRHLRKDLSGDPQTVKPVVIGFFHPYCNAGGGGERVLWVAIRALQNRFSHIRCVIYTGDVDVTGEEIIQKARQRFNIVIPRTDDIEFIYLRERKLIEASLYPYFTMLGQSLGSVLLGVEAMWRYVPDIYIDTMGYAFTLPLFKYLGGCSIACYVHYPTISTDMLERVSQRKDAFNNNSLVSRSPYLSYIKLQYYRLFAYIYGLVGKRSDLIMVNSSWTEGHILSLWQAPSKTYVIYPPCDTQGFEALPLDKKTSSPKTIASIAQFRPEKDHPLQLKAFSEFLNLKEGSQEQYKLVLVGSCRNADDQKRVDDLKQLAADLNIVEHIEFRLNVPYEDLKRCLCEATIGLHTMWNEHFGIGVVEMMAAGTIVLAHNSGGPKMDIVKNKTNQDQDPSHKKTGFLAQDVESYAKAMEEIFNMDSKSMQEIQLNARESMDRFSDEKFEIRFIDAMREMIL